MSEAIAQTGYDSYVRKLISASQRRGQRSLAQQQARAQASPTPKSYSPIQSHAAPLAALRYQDFAALDELFGDTTTMPTIAHDIDRQLTRLYPEPCWEDDAYEFLQAYL